MRTAIEGFGAAVAILFTFVIVFVLTKPSPDIDDSTSRSTIASIQPVESTPSKKYHDNSDVSAEWERIRRERAAEDLQGRLEEINEDAENSRQNLRAARERLDSDLQDIEFDNFDSQRRLRQRFDQIDRDYAKRKQEIEVESEIMQKKWDKN